MRLQGIGSGDARRGIGGYYDLAKEARAAANKCGGRAEEEEERRWKERLRELGLYIADALIETGDFAAAARHLESLRPRGGQDDTLDGRLALLHIHLGDVGAARRCLSNVGSADSQASLKPLLSMAEGRYTDAVEEWKALPKSDLATQNLAICLFYCGRVEETVNLLDGLVEKGRSFHALTFNLATVYELCSERGMERKGKLVGRVAKAIEQKGGGERGVIDFKM